MKIQILNFLTKSNIKFELGQVKGGYESLVIPYTKRAPFIKYLRANKTKIRDIIYSDDMKTVKLIFDRGAKL